MTKPAKSPQKRPLWSRRRNAQFGKTGWWRHSGTNWRPTTQSSNRSLRSASGTEFFDAETEGPDPPFCLAETDAETRKNSKKPAVHGTNARITRGVRYLKTAWWRRSGPNCMLPTQSSNQSPNLEPGTEFFAAETGAQTPPFRLLETGIETRRDSKKPRSGGISATKLNGVRSL